MRITDPRAVRALAHPLRLDLIEALVALGPSTAARCGRHLGVSQASCSFHLRQLAKYGFVEEAPPGQDRRERLWRLTELEQEWSSGPMTDQLDRVFIQREADRMLAWTGRRDGEPAAVAGRGVRGRGGAAGHRRRVAGSSGRSCGRCSSRTSSPLTDPATRPEERPVRPAVLLAGTPGPAGADTTAAVTWRREADAQD